MVRLCRGALGALALGLAVGAAGAQAPGGGWVPSWLGGGKPAPRPEDKAPSLKDSARTVPDQSAELAALRNAYLRRQAVCIRLQEIAESADDTALGEEARRLEGLAWQLYQERSGKLLGARSVGLGDGPKVDEVLDETRDAIIQKLEKARSAPKGGRATGMEGGR
jgi:hypothetical protein